MNKAKYVDKMTDLVESTLEAKGVSDDFTIADNYDERDEMSMTLLYDRSGHEVTFQLAEWYNQKKEADIKVKDQYSEHFKAQVEAFVDRELTQYRQNNNQLSEEWGGADYEDDRGEEDEEDYEDYEDEEDEDVEEEAEQSEAPTMEAAPIEPTHEEAAAPSQSFSSRITGLFKPLTFANVDSAGNVKAAVLPDSMKDKTPEELANRYKNQIKELFDDGAIVTRPNGHDMLVFDMSDYTTEDVREMMPELLEDGGSDAIYELENEKGQELP